MTVQELEQKLQAAEERLEKTNALLNKYIVKKNKTELVYLDLLTRKPMNDNGWVASHIFEITPEEHDICWNYKSACECVDATIKKIKELEKVRDTWKTRLELAKARENEFASIPQVVKDFVHNWRLKTYKFVLNEIYKAEVEYRNTQDLYSKAFNFKYKSPEYNEAYREYLNAAAEYKSKFSPLARSLVFKHDQEKELDKILAVEEKTKIFDLIKRVTKVIGKITVASNLRFGDQSGEINGIVNGEDGKAKVETIGAGGYAIQCYHFRVLVK